MSILYHWKQYEERKKGENMSDLYNFALEYNRGVNDGRKEILNDIVDIINNNEYPEDIEMSLCDYLESKGIKLYDN